MSTNTTSTSFVKTVSEMNAGISLADLNVELSRLLAAVRLSGKPGSITYRLTVKPAAEGDVTTVFLEDDIKSNLPRPNRPKAIFFTTETNGLQRHDPRQTEMQLKIVPEEPAPIITPAAAPEPIAAPAS